MVYPIREDHDEGLVHPHQWAREPEPPHVVRRRLFEGAASRSRSIVVDTAQNAAHAFAVVD